MCIIDVVKSSYAGSKQQEPSQARARSRKDTVPDAAHVLQVLRRPYKLARMNALEGMALVVLVLSLYLCTLFSTPEITQTARQVHLHPICAHQHLQHMCVRQFICTHVLCGICIAGAYS